MQRQNLSLKSVKREAHSRARRGRRKTASAPASDYRRFCRMLVEERRKAGLSQQEVADRLGKPQTYVSKCERGERRLDVVEFLKVAEAIGFSPARFIAKLARDEAGRKTVRGVTGEYA